MLPTITDKLVQEFIDRLEREGHSREYIDGALEGMSWVLEFYIAMMNLDKNREKYIRQEHETEIFT